MKKPLSSRALGVLARYAPNAKQKEYCTKKEYICNTEVVLNNYKNNTEEPAIEEVLPETIIIEKPTATTALATRKHNGYKLTEEQNIAERVMI